MKKIPGTVSVREYDGGREPVPLWLISEVDSDFIEDIERIEYNPRRAQRSKCLSAMPRRTHSYRFKYGRWTFGPGVGATFSVCSSDDEDGNRIGGRLCIAVGFLELDLLWRLRGGRNPT
jgi:hypothetical protein